MGKTDSADNMINSYIGGVIDAAGYFYVTARRDETHRLGYSFRTELRVMGLDDQTESTLLGWMGDVGVFPSTSGGIVVTKYDDIELLCEILFDYVITLGHDIEIVYEEIIPRVRNDLHKTESGLIELMEFADKINTRRDVKYSAEFFRDKFGVES